MLKKKKNLPSPQRTDRLPRWKRAHTNSRSGILPGRRSTKPTGKPHGSHARRKGPWRDRKHLAFLFSVQSVRLCLIRSGF